MTFYANDVQVGQTYEKVLFGGEGIRRMVIDKVEDNLITYRITRNDNDDPMFRVGKVLIRDYITLYTLVAKPKINRNLPSWF